MHSVNGRRRAPPPLLIIASRYQFPPSRCATIIRYPHRAQAEDRPARLTDLRVWPATVLQVGEDGRKNSGNEAGRK